MAAERAKEAQKYIEENKHNPFDAFIENTGISTNCALGVHLKRLELKREEMRARDAGNNT